MFNKYLLFAVILLSGGCLLFFHLWDNTKAELKSVKEQKIVLEKELKRRDDNEKHLSKRISELTELYNANADWANTGVPPRISSELKRGCKACQ